MATVTWKNDISGPWSTPSDWSTGSVPVSSSDVALPRYATAYTVTASTASGIITINSLVTGRDATLDITGNLAFIISNGTGSGVSAGTINVEHPGLLDITGVFANAPRGVIDNSGLLDLVGGTISGGMLINNTDAAIASSGGATNAINGGATVINNGFLEAVLGSTLTLTNVTVKGAGTVDDTVNGTGVIVFQDMKLGKESVQTVSDGSTLTLEGTITDNGALALGRSTGATIDLSGNVTLSGSGALEMSSSGDSITLVSGTATLTNNITIEGAGLIGDGGGHLTLVNHGAISANSSGRTLTIDTTAAVTNMGVLEANGDDLVIVNAVKNTGQGVIVAENGGSVTIGGALTGHGQIHLYALSAVTLEGAAQNMVIFESGAYGSSLILDQAQTFSRPVLGMRPQGSNSPETIDLANFAYATTKITSITQPGGGAAGTDTDVTLTDSSTGYSETLRLRNAYAGEYGTSPNHYLLAADTGSLAYHGGHGTLFEVQVVGVLHGV